MKKKIFLGLAMVAGLVSCTEDFTNWLSPQSNGASDPAQTLQMTVTPAVSSIDFASVTSPTIKLFSSSLTAAEADDYNVEITGEGVEETIVISADADGNVQTEELRQTVAKLYGAAPKERHLSIAVNTIATNATADGPVKVKRVASPFALVAKLDAPYIAENYYIVGGSKDWGPSKEQKFSHSDINVYDDPVFTIVIDAAASGDTWFAIGDDEGVEAIASGVWDHLFGIVGGDNTASSGYLDYRYNLGGENSFCVPASTGAKKIKVEINMMERTFKVETFKISDSYYLVGGHGSWSSDKSQKFSHSGKDVFEDPVFTYVFEGNGGTGDIWFAFGDAEALDAIDAGDWFQLYGYKGNDMAMSGSYDRRNTLGGEYTFHVDGTAKFYRFTINALEMTYEITPLNFDPYIYFIGATDGWANAEQKLALTDESGIYTGYLYCADPNGWGNEFKFQKVPGNWDTQLNSGSFTGGITGDFANGGDNIKATAGEGVYFVTMNLATNTLNAVKVNKMGIIGDFNGWGGDLEMTWNATDYCYEVTGATVNANGWKFRINGDWGINLGANDSVEPSTLTSDLVGNGKNLGAVGSTIKLYPTRKTSDKIYCTVE